MKNTPFLNLYKRSLPRKKLRAPKYSDYDVSALCDFFDRPDRAGEQAYETFQLLKPTGENFVQLKREGKARAAWGSDVYCGHDDEFYTFTGLRQTLVLLGAALNNEFKKRKSA